MEVVIRVVKVLENFLSGSTYLLSWFLEPIITFNLGFTTYTFSAIELVSITGITIFIQLAVVKWLFI